MKKQEGEEATVKWQQPGTILHVCDSGRCIDKPGDRPRRSELLRALSHLDLLLFRLKQITILNIYIVFSI